MEQQSPVMATDPIQSAKRLLALESRAKNGANWFFWIAGLSILNSIIFYFDGALTFVMELGLTQIVDGFVYGMSQELSTNVAGILRGMGILVNLLLAGVFVGFGYFAKKGMRWLLITGMVIYAIDAVIVGLFGDWLGVLFHLLALAGLWGGMRAIGQLAQLENYQKHGDMAGIQSIINPPVSTEMDTQRKRNFRLFSLIIIGLFGALTLFVVVMVALYAR